MCPGNHLGCRIWTYTCSINSQQLAQLSLSTFFPSQLVSFSCCCVGCVGSWVLVACVISLMEIHPSTHPTISFFLSFFLSFFFSFLSVPHLHFFTFFPSSPEFIEGVSQFSVKGDKEQKLRCKWTNCNITCLFKACTPHTTHTHTHTHTHSHSHSRTHAHTHTRTHCRVLKLL